LPAAASPVFVRASRPANKRQPYSFEMNSWSISKKLWPGSVTPATTLFKTLQKQFDHYPRSSAPSAENCRESKILRDCDTDKSQSEKAELKEFLPSITDRGLIISAGVCPTKL
jgi:hypothetical protein